MTNPFVERATEDMGAIERLLKGLPIIRGYYDKELRREADRRLRQTIAAGLEAERQRLYDLQKKLLKGGGLSFLDDVDGAIQKLQTLIDRVKTASYGYAGLFDAVKIREEQLEALHRFDVALAARTYEIKEVIGRVAAAIGNRDGLGDAIDALSDKLAEFNRLYDERHRAIDDPAYLTPEAAPAVDDEWMDAADNYAGESNTGESNTDTEGRG